MNNHEELRQQMWELAYGLLPPDEVAKLHALIKSDPAVARLYAEVRLQTDLVADAAKVADPTIKLKPQGPPTVIRPARTKEKRPQRAAATREASSRGANWLVGIAATALAVMIGVLIFPTAPSGDQLAQLFVATTVEVPATLQAGVSPTVRVQTTGADQLGRSAEVELSLVDASGQQRLRREIRTDDFGQATVELPGSELQADLRFKVTARLADPDHADEVAAIPPVEVAPVIVPEPIESYYLLDKPAYEPGETAKFAVRHLKRFSKQLVDKLPAKSELAAKEGYAPDANAATNSFTEESKSNQLAMLTDGSGQGEVLLPGADDLLRSLAVRQEDSPSAEEGRKDEFKRSLDEPSDELYYSDQVVDALASVPPFDASESQRYAFGGYSPESLVEARARHLKEALAENQSWFGKRIEAAGELRSEADRAPLGRVEANDFTQIPPTDGAPATSTVTTVEAGKPIEVPLPITEAEKLRIAAWCGDRIVANQQVTADTPRKALEGGKDNLFAYRAERTQKSANEPATEVVEIDAPSEADGKILVQVYNDSTYPPQLLSQNWYFRQPREHLTVELEGLKNEYIAGDEVVVNVRVVDEKGSPVEANVSVRVWNELLVRKSGSQPTDLANRLLRSERPGLEGESLALSNERLAFSGGGLGGVSNPAPTDETSAALGARADDEAAPSEPFERLNRTYDPEERFAGQIEHQNLAMEPLQATNASAVQAAYEAALSELREAATARRATAARLLLAGGLTLLILLAMQGLLRVSAKTYVWLPSAAVALAGLVLGVAWLAPQMGDGMVFEVASRVEGVANTTEAPKSQAAATDDDRVATPSDRFDTSEATAANGNAAPANAPMAPAPGADDRPLARKSDNRSTLAGEDARDKDASGKPSSDAAKMPREAGSQFFESAETRSFSAPVVDGPAGAAKDAAADSPPAPTASAAPRSEAAGARAGSSPPAEAAPPSAIDPQAAPTATGGRSEKESNSSSAIARTRGVAPGATKSLELTPRSGASASPPELQNRGGNAQAPAPPGPAMADRKLSPAQAGGAGAPPRPLSTPRPDAPVADREGAAPAAAEERETRDGQMAKKLEQSSESESVEVSDARDDRRVARSSSGNKAALSRGSEQKQLGDTWSAPAALLFEPSLRCDAEGRATIRFTLPAVDCEYRILVDAIGNGRIGSRQEVITGNAAPTSASDRQDE